MLVAAPAADMANTINKISALTNEPFGGIVLSIPMVY